MSGGGRRGLFARLFGAPAPRAASPAPRPLDFAHALDLVRRANGAVAAWAVGMRDGDLAAGAPGPGDELRERGAALVQLASADGRTHVAREGGSTLVAAGDFPYGAGLLLEQADPADSCIDAAVDDLRRLVAGMRLAEVDAPDAQGLLMAKQVAFTLSAAQTLDGIARAGAELAQQISHRGAAVVLLGNGTEAQVVATSTNADPRLAGWTIDPEAPVVRAIETRLPVVTRGGENVFGVGTPERRRQERSGAAYPLLDGRIAVGALVVVGAPPAAGGGDDGPVVERLLRLAADLGPRLAAAKAVHDAEQRAIRDPLTGLCNRREFERALADYRGARSRAPSVPPPPATLIYVDLDHFKRLNDTLGHAAGDAALRHVAQLLEAAVRDGDMVARIGGEEFAVWLPRTPPAQGLDVAERIREAVAGSTWQWRSSPYLLTTSCGVAAYPAPIGDLANLQAAADAALYRAKQAGRNRVEKAETGC